MMQRSPGEIIGNSLPIWKLKTYLRKVAVTDSHVLITGETGTGKELAAEYIHRHSLRSAKPLVTINCAALPDGLLESELFGYERGAFTGAVCSYPGRLKLADGGTVLFDEIGEMSPYAQAKILRFIEAKEVYPLGGRRSVPVDIRIIAATNKDLERQVSDREFRQDLYFRLNVARVHLPPLRERSDDIPLLLAHYVEKFSRTGDHGIDGFTEEAMDLLVRYAWPGNVRELINFIERLFIDPPDGQIGLTDLPEPIKAAVAVVETKRPDERELLLYTLSKTNWNKTQAAERLRWSRMTLYRKIEKYRVVEPLPDSIEGAIPDVNRRNQSAVKVTKL